MKSERSFGFSSDFTSSISLDSLWGSSDSSVSDWSDFDDSGVDGTTDTILHFEIQLWNNVVFESSVFFKILFGWLINNISDGESFDSLIFWTMSATVDTNDGSNISSVVFVSTVISSLLRHFMVLQLIIIKFNLIFSFYLFTILFKST